MTTQNPEATRPCYECQAGQMRPTMVTYFTWLADELITVPNFPAWICDVCGRREYDAHALSRLQLLLNPNAGRPSTPTRPSRVHNSPKGTRPAPE